MKVFLTSSYDFFLNIYDCQLIISLYLFQINEKVIEYSSNKTCFDKCENALAKNFVEGIKVDCKCDIKFSLKEKWEGDVFFYYGLSDFYQVCLLTYKYLYFENIKVKNLCC